MNSDYKGDRALQELLKMVSVNLIKSAPREHSQKTPSCPPLPRFREISIDPRKCTEEEKRHFEAGCAYCQKTFMMANEDMWHPSDVNLRLYAEGKELEGEESPYVSRHIEIDTCFKCQQFVEKIRTDRK